MVNLSLGASFLREVFGRTRSQGQVLASYCQAFFFALNNVLKKSGVVRVNFGGRCFFEIFGSFFFLSGEDELEGVWMDTLDLPFYFFGVLIVDAGFRCLAESH